LIYKDCFRVTFGRFAGAPDYDANPALQRIRYARR
jgi:hypothetical protein